MRCIKFGSKYSVLTVLIIIEKIILKLRHVLIFTMHLQVEMVFTLKL